MLGHDREINNTDVACAVNLQVRVYNATIGLRQHRASTSGVALGLNVVLDPLNPLIISLDITSGEVEVGDDGLE